MHNIHRTESDLPGDLTGTTNIGQDFLSDFMALTSPVTSTDEVDTCLHMSDVLSHVTELWRQHQATSQQQLPKMADLHDVGYMLECSVFNYRFQ